MRATDITSLTTLREPQFVLALRSLAIVTVDDLATYPAFRHAELLVGLDRNAVDGHSLAEQYLRPGHRRAGVPLSAHPPTVLRSVSQPEAERLRDALRLDTLGALASWPPFREAVAILSRAGRPAFSEPPSAPDALIPTLIGSTHTATRLANYVKDRSVDIEDQQLAVVEQPDEIAPRRELLNIFTRDVITFDLGYLAAVRQAWVNAGTHLGEIMHSLALAPGESRNIAVLDWTQRQRSSRSEDTRANERLQSEFQQTRAINEVVSSTAREHLEGMTNIDATTKTTGTGITGGVGGGGAKSNSGSASVNVGEGLLGSLGALVGLPISGGGSAASSNLLSGAGGIGASYVHSNGTVQGTLMSETSGEREVLGELVQNISDATVQNSSNVRALMSTVVVEDEQEGRQRSQTRNITNYNHSHALTMQYYEVLQKYLVRTQVASMTPVLFLPFRPLRFTIGFIKEYWPVLRDVVRLAYPARFREYDQVVKDFDPRNNAFDASGELEITTVRITRTRSWSSIVKVELPEANPSVKLSYPGFRLDDTLTLALVGSSTYLSYEVLEEEEYEEDTFAGADAIPVDANVVCRIDSAFKQRFRTELKQAIDDAKKVADFDRGFNELGSGNNKTNLKDDVDAGQYELLNPSDGVTCSLDFTFTVRDPNGNEEVITHQHAVTFTYKQLHDEIDQELFNVTDVITAALGGTADFNPLDTIEDLEDHFRLHRYGYTRYLLSVLEKEQIVDVIEHLAAAGSGRRIALSRIVDPSPLAVVNNTLIFKLRSLKPMGDEADGIRAVCSDYVSELRSVAAEAERWARAETVFLPTAGLFGEAILGLSNASEYLNLRRFFNWQDSPIPNSAPSIVAVDLNQQRGNAVADGLTPTVVDSTLAQQLPTAYAMPTGLTSALQAVQNGQMFTDMSKTSDLTGVLGNLSALANNTAQLAGTLSGDAMAKALDSAVALGSQVAAMTQTALGKTPAAAPMTLTAQGAQRNNIDDVSATPTPPAELSDVDKARIAAGGTEVQPCPDVEPPAYTTPPAPPATEPDAPDAPDDPDDPAIPPVDEAIRLSFRLAVPSESVRLDVSQAAWSAVPQSVKDFSSTALSLMGSWVYAVGFDEEGGSTALSEALKLFLTVTPAVGEVILLVEGLKALIDFVGADEDVAAEAVVAAGEYVTMVMDTMQALVLPAMKGGEWLTMQVRVDVPASGPVATIEEWDAPGIPYGFLTSADPSADGIWWKGDSWSAQMWSTVNIDVNSVSTSAVLEADGALLVTLQGSALLALTWSQVLAGKSQEIAAKLREVLSYPGVADGVAQALGVTNAQTELVSRAAAAFKVLVDGVVRTVQQYFTPHIDFDLDVRIVNKGTAGWSLTVSGAHDMFPEYTLVLLGPDGATEEELYVGPAAVENSSEGPLGLMESGTVSPTIRSVPADWIVDWAATSAP